MLLLLFFNNYSVCVKLVGGCTIIMKPLWCPGRTKVAEIPEIPKEVGN
jgi:hypothetical protein